MTAKKKIQCHTIGWVGILVLMLGGCGAFKTDVSAVYDENGQNSKIVFEDRVFD